MFVLDAGPLRIDTGWLQYSPIDPMLLVSTTALGVKIWDLQAREPRLTLEKKPPLCSPAFSPDGKYLLLCELTAKNARIFHVKTGRLYRRIKLSRFFDGFCARYAPDGESIAIAGSTFTVDLLKGFQGVLRRWNLKTSAQRKTIHDHNIGINVFDFSHDGKYLVTGGGDGLAILRDANTCEKLATLKHRGSVWGTCFSRDNSILATVGGWNIVLWEVPSGKRLATLRGHKSTVFGLAMSPDGDKLASASSDHTVRVWSLSSQTELAVYRWEIGPLTSVAFSSDGMTAAASSERGKIAVWDVDNG